MIKIANSFDPETGLHTALPLIREKYSNAVLVKLSETEAIVYMPGDEIPSRENDGLELVQGDNPATPELEKSWWRKTLEAVGLK